MDLNRTLKTYDDGSQMTVAGAIATVGISLVAGALGTVIVVAKDNWSERRTMKKYHMGPYANK